MKHKRIWSWLVVALVIIGLLAGCAPKPTPAPATQPPAAPTATPAPKPTDTPKPAKTHFVIATDASFPPMEFVDENKNLVGFDIDLMEAIAKAMGFTVEWKNTAWDGIFAGLESGDYDAIMSSVTITDERKQKYDFSDPYINAGQAVVVRADETAIQSYKDLSGKVVGAQIGTTGAFAVEKIEGAKLKEYDTIDLALMDLVNKNIDAVVVDTPVAADYALASETFKGKLKIVGEPFTEEYYGLCVRKGETELLKLFNEGLKKVKASGEYDKIYKKWIAGEGTAPAGAGAAVPPPNPDAKSLLRWVEAVDEYTVKFYLNRPNASFINTLAMNNFAIMSPAAIEKYGPDIFKNPVGTGPYIFKEWIPNDKITVVANPNYWGEAPKIKTVVFRAIPDNSARFLELKAGTIDGMEGANPDDIAVAEKDPNLQVLWRPAFNVGYLGINMAMKPFDDVRVRKAIAYAIDKKAIVDAFYAGFGEPAKEFMPPSLWGYDPDIEDYPYDPAKAKELLAEAGFPNGFETELWVMPVARPYFPQPAQVGEAIQQYLADVGIKAKIVQYDWGTYLDKIAAGGEHKLFMLGWTGDNGDPDNFLCVFFCGGDNSFNMGPADPALKDLLMKAVAETDFAKREEMYKQANRMIHDLVPGVPIAHTKVPIFLKKTIKNFIPSPIGLPYWWLAENEAGDTVIYGRSGDSVGLDPANVTDGESLMVTEQMLEGLVALEAGTTNPVPSLAVEWTASPDGLEWTFKLRQGVEFHDGTPFNAEAVVFNFMRWWDPAHPYHFADWTWDYWAYMFGGFKGE